MSADKNIIHEIMVAQIFIFYQILDIIFQTQSYRFVGCRSFIRMSKITQSHAWLTIATYDILPIVMLGKGATFHYNCVHLYQSGGSMANEKHLQWIVVKYGLVHGGFLINPFNDKEKIRK